MYNKPYNIHVLDHTRLFKKSMIQKNAQSPTTHPPKSSEKKKKQRPENRRPPDTVGETYPQWRSPVATLPWQIGPWDI